MAKLKVAIIGQGRSGRDIHGAFFKSEANTLYEVVAVVDADALRRSRALEEYPGCQVYADYKELFSLKNIDLVVNSTFSHQHYSVTKDLLLHKFNVLVEKPMARNYYECCDLMETAKANGVTLAVFQQTFLAPVYEEPKAFIASGKLGDILQISIHYSGFARRWDWQTLQCKLGGSVYNTGPHPIGMALGFLDFHPEAKVIYSKLACALTSGDAEDYAKIILTAPGKPVVDVEISSVDAFSPFNVKIQGTKGTYMCTTASYKAKYITDGENQEQPVIQEFIMDENSYPAYCKETLISHEEENNFIGSAFTSAAKKLYDSLYQTITTGVPLAVPSEHAAQVIRVIEAVHAQNPLPVKYITEDFEH